MKLFFVLTMAFLTTSVLAKSLEEKKTKLISGLDERISELQKSKSCIQQAQDEKIFVGMSKNRKPKPKREIKEKIERSN